VEITKDIVLERRNIKTSDSYGIATEIAKVFSTLKEGIGLDGGWEGKLQNAL
jgi:hypothetical protein